MITQQNINTFLSALLVIVDPENIQFSMIYYVYNITNILFYVVMNWWGGYAYLYIWMNEWMKSYIAHVSSRRLFRALYIESNLARPVIIQIPTQSPGRYTAELPLRRIKLFSFQANSPYVPSTHTLWIFWGLAGWKLRLRPLRFFYVQL